MKCIISINISQESTELLSNTALEILPSCVGKKSSQTKWLPISQETRRKRELKSYQKMENLRPCTSFNSVQSLSRVWLFATPWTAARQASLSITNSRGLLKLMSIESVMSSNHLILCCPLLLPSVFPSIRDFSNESALRIRWPKDWSFNFNISPSNEYSGLITSRTD